MIYHPLATLLSAGVREILVITTPRDQRQFRTLLGDGSAFGAQLSFIVQRSPRGIPDALVVGRRFAGDRRVALILGDNVFHGAELPIALTTAGDGAGAHCFAYRVPNPAEYGVVEFSRLGQAVSIAEKPTNGRSPWALTGLYVLPPHAWTGIRALSPSTRGELEITDLLRAFLEQDALTVHRLTRRTTWIDAGTPESLLAASTFVASTQRRTRLPVGSPEFAAVAGGLVKRTAMLKSMRARPDEYAKLVARALAQSAS